MFYDYLQNEFNNGLKHHQIKNTLVTASIVIRHKLHRSNDMDDELERASKSTRRNAQYRTKALNLIWHLLYVASTGTQPEVLTVEVTSLYLIKPGDEEVSVDTSKLSAEILNMPHDHGAIVHFDNNDKIVNATIRKLSEITDKHTYFKYVTRTECSLDDDKKDSYKKYKNADWTFEMANYLYENMDVLIDFIFSTYRYFGGLIRQCNERTSEIQKKINSNNGGLYKKNLKRRATVYSNYTGSSDDESDRDLTTNDLDSDNDTHRATKHKKYYRRQPKNTVATWNNATDHLQPFDVIVKQEIEKNKSDQKIPAILCKLYCAMILELDLEYFLNSWIRMRMAPTEFLDCDIKLLHAIIIELISLKYSKLEASLKIDFFKSEVKEAQYNLVLEQLREIAIEIKYRKFTIQEIGTKAFHMYNIKDFASRSCHTEIIEYFHSYGQLEPEIQTNQDASFIVLNHNGAVYVYDVLSLPKTPAKQLSDLCWSERLDLVFQYFMNLPDSQKNVFKCYKIITVHRISELYIQFDILPPEIVIDKNKPSYLYFSTRGLGRTTNFVKLISMDSKCKNPTPNPRQKRPKICSPIQSDDAFFNRKYEDPNFPKLIPLNIMYMQRLSKLKAREIVNFNMENEKIKREIKEDAYEKPTYQYNTAQTIKLNEMYKAARKFNNVESITAATNIAVGIGDADVDLSYIKTECDAEVNTDDNCVEIGNIHN